jgi:cytoskeleton protein RodZ
MSDVAPDDFSQEQSAQRPAFVAGQTLGQRLAAEREARGWAIEYVAGQLNLAMRQIQALENDHYAALPGIASVRGFVRAYAKLLKVEADPLVALIANEQIVPNQPLEPKPNLSSAPFAHSRLDGVPGRGNSLKGAAIALIVVLLAAGAIGIEHMGGWPTLSQSLSTQFKDLAGGSSNSGASPAENHDATQETLPAKTMQESDDAIAGKDDSPPGIQHDAVKDTPTAPTPVTAPAASGEKSSTGSVSAPVKISPSKSETPAPVVVPKTPSGAASGGTLVLTARQNSWIDVRAGSNVIASHLLKAGDTENIDVPVAAQLTIGNAAAVSATFRGQPVPTTSDGKTNVAHIALK